jgi:hypothetical protein
MFLFGVQKKCNILYTLLVGVVIIPERHTEYTTQLENIWKISAKLLLSQADRGTQFAENLRYRGAIPFGLHIVP